MDTQKIPGNTTPAILFQETQQFRQWWLWLLFLAAEVFFIYLLIQQLAFHKPIGNKPAPNGLLIFLFLLISAFVYLLYRTRLDTKIDTEGIAWRWQPFQRKYRKILWQDIAEATVIKYFPLGYGWHLSLRYGEVYNTGGNRGLLLTFSNKRKMLIGTRCPDEISALLRQIIK